ncbi:nucleotidyltransferase family protein [Synechococcus sp. CBW1004]|uniref:nucleotidyltransferase family protein n=1 Tax=Synechococcus sp. CBW1004 TaxID=1353136 RepID=UPI0018CF2FBC|nr:nucleotidyltransferase family protein [Synechococcus sp. CBW1004]QPN63434.1 nucleotidyltransferase family protein [Synechococcus sp. CBW1004]
MTDSAPSAGSLSSNPNVGLYLPLMVTRRCNLGCAHCSVESSPELRDRQPTEQELLEVVRQAAAAGVRAIQFTGGEPMLRQQLVLKLIRESRRLGIGSTLTTNGFWGCTPKLARTRLQALLAAGLARLTVSFDRYHAAFQGPEPAVNIVEAGAVLGLPVNINITRVQDEDDIDAFVAPFAELPTAQLRFYDVQPVGAAARNTPDHQWRGQTSGFCRACDAATVTDDGRLIACNGPAYFTPPGHPLHIGSLSDKPLSALLAAHRDDPLLDAIRTLGPERLRAELVKIPGFEAFPFHDRYRGLCDLCLHITGDPSAAAALREHMAHGLLAAERHAMALLIADQRRAGALNRRIVNAEAAARLFHQGITTGTSSWRSEASRLLGRADLDWQQQAAMLLASGLARPLLPVLDAPELQRWAPAFFNTRVREAALRDGLREVVQMDALERIDRALTLLGGRGVLLKGAAFLARGGEQTVLRAAGDVDLLVDERLAQPLRHQLIADGFQGDPNAMRSAQHHLAPISWRGVPIEIHTGIMPAFWGLPERQMLQRSWAVPGFSALDTLDPEGMILHAVTHATTHLFGQGHKLAWDVQHVLQTAGRPLDWPRLQAWVEACAVPRAFWVPCAVVAREMTLEIPAAFLVSAPADRRQRQLELIAQRRLFTAIESTFAINPLSRTAVFLLLHDGLPARLAYLHMLFGSAAREARRSAASHSAVQRPTALPAHLREAWKQLRQFRAVCRTLP